MPKRLRLDTPAIRAKLAPRHAPYWVSVARGVSIGYRKGARDATWQVRRASAQRYTHKVLGLADDAGYEADGERILSWSQVLEKAVNYTPVGTITVDDAFRLYREDYSVRSGRDLANLDYAYNKHIRQQLGRFKVSALTPSRLRQWLNRTAGGTDASRASKTTANRTLNRLKAILNFAYAEGYVSADSGWRSVRAFRGVTEARVRIITDEEARKLIAATEPAFQPMVRAAVMTGCRYSELCRLTVGDCFGDHIHIPESKTGAQRDVPLAADGERFFAVAIAGKPAGARVFTHADGRPWGRGHQGQRLRDASKAAGITPPITFHLLRHYYGGALARAGVSMQVIAKALGHADSRITEKHYAHLAPSHVADVIRANLPSLEPHTDNVVPIGKVEEK